MWFHSTCFQPVYFQIWLQKFSDFFFCWTYLSVLTFQKFCYLLIGNYCINKTDIFSMFRAKNHFVFYFFRYLCVKKKKKNTHQHTPTHTHLVAKLQCVCSFGNILVSFLGLIQFLAVIYLHSWLALVQSWQNFKLPNQVKTQFKPPNQVKTQTDHDFIHWNMLSRAR